VPHGGDVETWCAFNGSDPVSLSVGMRNAGIFQLMPSMFRTYYISKVMKKFKEGLSLMDGVLYFPEKFTSVTKKIATYCRANNLFYWERYDISLEPLNNIKVNSVENSKRSLDLERPFIILVPVRFAYKTFPEGNKEFNKGSDLIILGINRFLESLPDSQKVSVVFYEKGVDLAAAKCMVEGLPILRQALTWRSSVPFDRFLIELLEADFCFDGVGEHWPGAVAAYGLVLGVNVGANFGKVRHLLPAKIPNLYSVSTEFEIYEALKSSFQRRSKYSVSDDVLNEIRKAYSTMSVAQKIYGIL